MQRRKFKGYDGLNNFFNLAYRFLSWKIHVALVRAKLEPYLGFLHGIQFGKPSLVCHFLELYRYLIDNFLIEHARNLKSGDFVIKVEDFSRRRKGKRKYLNKTMTNEFIKRINTYFESKVAIPRKRVGKRQELETLISEEALLLGKDLRVSKAILLFSTAKTPFQPALCRPREIPPHPTKISMWLKEERFIEQ